MFKIILFVSTALLSFTLHAQSKEETINWLNTNATALLTVNNKIGKEDHVRRFIEVRNDTLRLYARHDCDCGTWSTHEYEYYLPVKSILYQDVNSLSMDEKK
jgi:hypothetical protein